MMEKLYENIIFLEYMSLAIKIRKYRSSLSIVFDNYHLHMPHKSFEHPYFFHCLLLTSKLTKFIPYKKFKYCFCCFCAYLTDL